MCVWVEDADKLVIDSPELAIVFSNRRVRAFLNSKDCLGVAGIKGQGKTFLIKVKRKKSEEICPNCIPRDMLVDTVDSSLHIDESLSKLLMDYTSWVKLWKASLCITIIRYVLDLVPGEELDVPESLNSSTETLIESKNKNAQPSLILNMLLQMNVREVLRVFEDIPVLASVVSGINRSIFVFMDKIDQGFSGYARNYNQDSVAPHRSRNASIWQYAQFGLAEAAYDMYCIGTHHVKVYFTIRQEALIDCEKMNMDKARNILAFIATLYYSKSDLEEMYNLYIANEKDSNLVWKEYKEESPSMAFLGITYIKHGYVESTNEPVFDYIYRHTLQRPYDIMRICRALYFEVKDVNLETIRHTINHESNMIFSIYIQELSDFIPISVDAIYKMAKMINSNILSLEYMKEVCALLNKENDHTLTCNNVCYQCDNIQPFSILFNLGLIGTIKKNPADKVPLQSFTNVGNSILGLKIHHLTKSEYYFVHPALANYARDSRFTDGMHYWSNDQVIVGDRCAFAPQNKRALSRYIRRSIDQLKKEKVFISSTINDLSEVRKVIQCTLSARGLHPVLSEMPDFDIVDAQDFHSHDHCIDELLKCRSVIFLIGEQYGGPYRGEKYVTERDELIEEAKAAGKEIYPSISLMEFYVARKNKLTCYAFINKSLETRIYDKEDKTVDENIRKEVKFINHIKEGDNIRGNWISAYVDLADLSKRVDSLKFSTRQ